MTDVHTKEKRSRNMAAIKCRDTKPEMYIRKLLFSEGFRYRLHKKNLPGKPDLVFARYRSVIFINGCFWHGHGCHLGRTPKSNIEFWNKKLRVNADRDSKNIAALRNYKWKVIVIWECSIKGRSKLADEDLKDRLIYLLKVDSSSMYEISGKE